MYTLTRILPTATGSDHVDILDPITSAPTPMVTFTRSSTASYYDANGTLKTAAINTPRIDHDPVTKAVKGLLIEESRTNLLTYSEQFQESVWVKLNASPLTNSAVSPDGLLKATHLLADTTNGVHQVRHQVSASVTVPYSFSVYLKAGGYSKAQLVIGDGPGTTNNVNIYVDLTSGQITATNNIGNGSGATGSAISVGGGWWRVTVSGTPSSSAGTTLNIVARIVNDSGANSFVGDPTKGLYLWGAQLEAGAFPTSYVPSTTTFTSRASAASYTDNTGVLKFAGQNLLTYSEQFDNAAWAKNNLTATANTTTGPTGAATADTITATTSAPYMEQTVTAAGTTFVVSAWIKGVGSSIGKHALLRVVRDAYAQTLTSQPLIITGEWQRISFAGTFSTAAATVKGRIDPIQSSEAVIGDSVYIWGAQLEQGHIASEYIPTTTAAITQARTGDHGLVSGQWINKGLVLEGAATNLRSFSQQFAVSPAWTQSEATSAPNRAVAPDGTLGAHKLIANTASAAHRLLGSGIVLSATSYTFSVYAKADDLNHLYLRVNGGLGDIGIANFNLATGIVTQQVAGTASITPYGNGWYRCSVTTLTADATNYYPEIRLSNANTHATFSGTGSNGVFIWGAQVETGSVATSYVPSNTSFTSRSTTATYFDSNGVMQTAAINVPRYGYGLDGGVWKPKGLELEAAATNLLTHSGDPTNAAWSTVGLASVVGGFAAPDGSMLAVRTVEDTSNGTHYRRSASFTTATSTTYTGSLFVKAGERNKVMLTFTTATTWTGSINPSAVFDLVTGEVSSLVGTSTTARMTNAGNGWWRCELTATAIGVLASHLAPLLHNGTATGYTGDGTSGLYIWGAQVETGSVATSYIPTTTATVTRAADVSASVAGTRAADVSSSVATTRAADVAQVTGANFSSWYNQSEGTFVSTHTFSTTANTPGNFAWQVDDNGSTSNRMSIFHSSGGAATHSSHVIAGGVAQARTDRAGTITAGQQLKHSFGYKENNVGDSLNGSITTTDASASIPTVNALGIGRLGTGASGFAINGHIRRITYWPRRLSNIQLQELSQ